MGKVTFKIDDTLKSIVAHAAAQPAGTLYGEPLDQPSVLIVKDQGVYLMSGAPKRQFDEEAKDRCVVQYAAEANPETMDFDDCWHAARELCGGDDFCEAIPVPFLQDAVDRGMTRFAVIFRGEQMELVAS